MKILMPVEVFYPSQAGGPANSVHYLAKYLDKDRFEPIVVATDRGLGTEFQRNKWANTESGEVIHVKTRHSIFPLRAAWAALKKIRSSDVVHLNSIFFPSAFVAAFAGHLLKKKL